MGIQKMNRWFSRKIPFFCFAMAIVFFGCKKVANIVPGGGSTGGGSTDTAWLNGTSNKPNIIFILSDDIGYEVPTMDGGQSYSTPRIDMMAQQGKVFTQCHATPLCSPSRIMLMTGKYNYRNYTQWGVMNLSSLTIANMLQGAGYNCYSLGKWQFDNGDLGERTFGFNKYCIFNPFQDTLNGDIYRYKNPLLFSGGNYIPSSQTYGKYCDDICVDSMVGYMHQSIAANKPFFVYYGMSIGHTPFCPTPNDPQYAAWNPLVDKSDPTYFPSMVNYMDIKVGQILDSLAALGLSNHTLVIFSGDNGTDGEIHSLFQGKRVRGGKSYTIETGTHVPLIFYMPGSILPGTVNNDLISFSDFLPTIADVAKIPVPASFGPIDGISFYQQLLGNVGTPREWIYWYYNALRSGEDTANLGLSVWAQNADYKIYSQSVQSHETGVLYNYPNDHRERSPLSNGQLTPDQLSLETQLNNVMLANGVPIQTQ